MTTTIDLICMNCKHKFEFQLGCAAFPDDFGIPDEILQTNQHSIPLPEQDNDIVFEPKTN